MRSPPELYLRASLAVPAGWEESLSFLLQEDGWGAVIEEQHFPGGHVEGGPPPRATDRALVVLLPPARRAAFEQRLSELARTWGWQPGEWGVRFEEHRDRDWESLWKRHWRPFRCGRFVVHADFHAPDALSEREGDRRLVVVPGSAFGTGLHASTRLGLRALERWCEEGAPKSLLDVGTGTGILAVAGAVLGVARAAGMDPDRASAPQARQMALRNGVAARCVFWTGRLETAGGTWDACTANLQAELLQRYASALAARLVPGARLFAGGILDCKLEETVERLVASGFGRLATRGSGRWRALEMRSQCVS